jgi:FMN reductase
MKAVAISGSPRSPSKSKALAEALLKALEARGFETRLIDLALLPSDALLARLPSPEVDQAIVAVGDADIIVAATPTYRALYTGLLKCFFDLMPQSHLAGKNCVGVQTGLAAEHALAVEYGFRPLFSSLDGVPVAVVYATDSQFVEGAPDADLLGRLDKIAATLVAA